VLRGAPRVGTTIGQFKATESSTRKLQLKNNQPRLNLEGKGFRAERWRLRHQYWHPLHAED
jgi:hypothetical protein